MNLDLSSVPPERDMPLVHLEARKQHLIREARLATSERRRRPGSTFAGVRVSRRYLALVAVLALIALLATPAFGVLGRVRDLFEGTPPTPLVQQHFGLISKMLEKQNKDAAARAFSPIPQIDPSKIHGLVSVTAPDHQVNLWVAPTTDDRGDWWLLQIDGEKDPNNTLYGPSGSFSNNPFETHGNIDWTEFGDINLPSMRILLGRVFADATSVDAQLANGATVHLPVVEHFFLALLDEDARTSKITAYDADGKQTGQSTQGMVIG
jgi:hypothetical protein